MLYAAGCHHHYAFIHMLKDDYDNTEAYSADQIGVHCEGRYINVSIQYSTILYLAL